MNIKGASGGGKDILSDAWKHEFTVTAKEAVKKYAPVEVVCEAQHISGSKFAAGSSFSNQHHFIISPDGNHLVVLTYYTPNFAVYNLRSGNYEMIQGKPAGMLGGWADYPPAFSPEGDILALPTSTTLCELVKRTGNSYSYLGKLGGTSDVGGGCAFTPDGEYLTVFRLKTASMQVYKRNGDSFVQAFTRTGTNFGGQCAYAVKGKYLIAASGEGSTLAEIYLRNGAEHTLLGTVPGTSGLGRVSVSPDGNCLLFTKGSRSISTSQRIIRLVEEADGSVKFLTINTTSIPGTVGGFSPDGMFAYAVNGSTKLLDIYKQNGDFAEKVNSLAAAVLGGGGFAISPDGTKIAHESATGDGQVGIVDIFRTYYAQNLRADSSFRQAGDVMGIGMAMEDAGAGGGVKVNMFNPFNEKWKGQINY